MGRSTSARCQILYSRVFCRWANHQTMNWQWLILSPYLKVQSSAGHMGMPAGTVFGWPYGLSNQWMATEGSQGDLTLYLLVIRESNLPRGASFGWPYELPDWLNANSMLSEWLLQPSGSQIYSWYKLQLTIWSAGPVNGNSRFSTDLYRHKRSQFLGGNLPMSKRDFAAE